MIFFCLCFSVSAGELLAERYADGAWLFFIRRADVMDIPASEAAGTASANLLRILGMDFAAFEDGVPYPLDENANIHFSLSDTKSNVYPLLSTASTDTPLSLPSDPEQDVSLTAPVRKLYFRIPPDMTDDLILEVDASALMGQSFRLSLPRDKINFVQSIHVPRWPQDEDFQVTGPSAHAEVLAGEKVPLAIALDPQIRKPDKILIITPFSTFEDDTALGRYTVQVQPQSDPGPYDILVLGVWEKGSETLTISRLVPLRVAPSRNAPFPKVCPFVPRP